MGLERDPLSLVSTIEELLGRKSSGSGLQSQEYARRDPSRWSRGTLHPQKLALTSPTSSCRSVGLICSQTQTTEFSFICIIVSFLISHILYTSLPLSASTSCATCLPVVLIAFVVSCSWYFGYARWWALGETSIYFCEPISFDSRIGSRQGIP
jgi:hypothetical protein